MERLQALGIGVKGDIQKQREATPGMNWVGTRSGPEYADIKEQERINREAGVTLKRYDGKLKSGEKLRNIGGVTYVVPAAAPIVERNIERRPQSYSSLDTLTGDVREEYIPGVQAQSNIGLFDASTPVPTRPDFTPQRLPEIDPTRQTEGMGGSTQEVIPVSPDDAIQTLMARLTNYYKDDTPAMPVRRQDVAPIPQAFTPRPEPMQGPGLMTPQLPQPNVPNLDVQAYAPDMFRGQLPMPEPTSQMFVDEEGNLVDVLGNIVQVADKTTTVPDYETMDIPYGRDAFIDDSEF